MKADFLNIILLAISFLILFGIGELAYHIGKVQVEYTRKLVHLGTGLLTLLFPVYLQSHWSVLLLCCSFAAILILSLKYNLLPSINAIERKSVGSLAYPAAVYLCFLAFEFLTPGQGDGEKQMVYFYLPMLTLAICDPIAALVGKRFPFGKFSIGKDTKTVMGSAAFFLSALVVSFFCLTYNNKVLPSSGFYFSSFFVAILATVAEGWSGKGFDNITIPVAVLLALTILTNVNI